MIVSSDLSEYSKACLELFTSRKKMIKYSSQKLTTSLEGRDNYILHYRNLSLYLSLGMKLHKIHKCIGFKQKRFIQKFIQVMTKKRIECLTPFEKRQWKLVQNANFGEY